MTGKGVSKPRSPLFLLDESLVPNVAKALNTVGYNFSTVNEALGKGVQDPEIIEWCKEKNAVWVHADDRAKKEHRKLLQASGIHTLWVYRKQGQMTGKEQLRILAFVLPKFLKAMEVRNAKRHFRASAVHELATPSLRSIDI